MVERPNILLILTDQQNASMMSNAGNPYVRTPAIDSLASNGIRFNRAYCTNPVCIPSRFSLMTGRMPSEIGMRSNNMSHIESVSEEVKNNGLGWLMQQAGYDVAYAGKAHLPRMTVADVGFDYLCKDERDLVPDVCGEYMCRKRNKPFFLVASLINPHDICYMAINDFKNTNEERDLINRASVERSTLDKALCRPVGVDEEAFFREHCPPLPPNFEPQEDEPEAIRFMLKQRPFRVHARQEWSEQRWREHRWAYARLTEIVDAQIARLLATLQGCGQQGNTLVIFTSDHGDMDAAHRMEHKSTLYEEACHIPLIVRPPDGTQPRNDNRLVSNGLDLLPTFCDYAGIKPPTGLQGRSLRPIVEGREATWRNSVPVECAIGGALVTDAYKYAVYDMGNSNEQLYDLKNDRFEQRNALNDAHLQLTVASMRAEFSQMFSQKERLLEDIRKDAAKG